MEVIGRRQLERRWVVVAAGWRGEPKVAGAVGSPSGAGVVVVFSFGGDASGAVLGSGAAASGHHRGALAALVQRRSGFWWQQIAGRNAQAGKQ